MNLKKNNNMNAPKKKANKNDVYAIILAILIIFWTIASVFGFIGYARASKNRDTGMITANADETSVTSDGYFIEKGYYVGAGSPSLPSSAVTITLEYLSGGVSFSSLYFYPSSILGNPDANFFYSDGAWNASYMRGRVIYVEDDTPCSAVQYTAFYGVYSSFRYDYGYRTLRGAFLFKNRLNFFFWSNASSFSVLNYNNGTNNGDYSSNFTFLVGDSSFTTMQCGRSTFETGVNVYANGSWLDSSYRTFVVETSTLVPTQFFEFIIYNCEYLGEDIDIPGDSSGGSDSGSDDNDTPQENPIITQQFNNYSISLDELNGLSVGDSSETGFSYELGYKHQIYVVGAQLTYNDYILTDSEGVVQDDIPANFTFRSFSDRSYTNCGGYIEIVENDYSVGDYYIPDTGYNVFTDYTCYISDTTGVGLDFEYTLTFKWYETLQDTNPIEFDFSFIITISFGNLYSTYTGYSLYMPMDNVVLTDSATYYSTEYFQSQQSRFDNLALTYTSAYNNGYNKGVLAGSTGGNGDTTAPTFFNLITAVVDAPIQAFTGLFNFDLLGVNLTSFFLALLTVAVFIAVIRLIL